MTENTKIDNLSKYGLTFQSKVLAILLSCPDFLQQSFDVLNPNFFESDSNKWIVSNTMDYFGEYKKIPTLDVFKLELESVQDEALKISVRDQLRAAYQRKSDSDLDYVKKSFLDFAKNQAIKGAIIESVDLLQIGEYEKIKKVVDVALRAGQPKNVGHDWKEDFAIRLEGATRITIPTGWEAIDTLIDGGLGAGELGVIAAPSGIGKSWALATIGANAAKQGKLVLHYTLELNENYVGLRYDTIFTSIPTTEIPNNPDAIKDIVKKIPGGIIIKYFPARSVTVNTLHAHIQTMISNGLAPDMVLVDYADLMRSIDKVDARYQELGAIYEELRGMCGELGIPCWTASQTQRSSIQDEIIQADKISESYNKIMTADLVISLSRKVEDKANHTGRAHIIKSRFGNDGITFPVYMNTSLGKIEIYDENSSRGIQLKKQMHASEGVLKKSLARKFTQLHTDLEDDGD